MFYIRMLWKLPHVGLACLRDNADVDIFHVVRPSVVMADHRERGERIKPNPKRVSDRYQSQQLCALQLPALTQVVRETRSRWSLPFLAVVTHLREESFSSSGAFCCGLRSLVDYLLSG
jgi:hypothetical protein